MEDEYLGPARLEVWGTRAESGADADVLAIALLLDPQRRSHIRDHIGNLFVCGYKVTTTR